VSVASLHHDHLRLSVRLTPNGGRDAFDGVETDAEGRDYLKARVAAVPEDGKANTALTALLSKKLRVPKSAIPSFPARPRVKKSSGSRVTRRICRKGWTPWSKKAEAYFDAL
jgi:uncharacterized protein